MKTDFSFSLSFAQFRLFLRRGLKIPSLFFLLALLPVFPVSLYAQRGGETVRSLPACLQPVVADCVDWANGVVYVVREAALSSRNNLSSTQRKEEATLIADVKANAAFLEVFEETVIESKRNIASIKGDTQGGQFIKEEAKGVIRHVQREGPPVYLAGEDKVRVIKKMYFRNFMKYLTESLPALNESVPGWKKEPFRSDYGSPSAQGYDNRSEGNPPLTDAGEANGVSTSNYEEGKIYTGLILKAENLDVAPREVIGIFDENGRRIYGSASVKREWLDRYGTSAFGVMERFSDGGHQRIGKRPLIMRAIGLVPGTDNHLIIANRDGLILSELNRTLSFLREARVAVTVKPR